MKVSNNIKFYKFISILSKFSDENNILSTKTINDHMVKEVGVKLDRRTLYAYISDMNELGIDVSTYEENKKGYYIRTPNLEEYELRILFDLICASKCITKKKTQELIDKLSGLTNIYIGDDLSKNTYIENRSKSINEEILYNIDKINNAIKNNKKITFNYYDYNHKRELLPKMVNDHELKLYTANPIAMILKEDYYYVVLNIDKYNDLSNYRIDRIKNINIIDEPRKSLNLIDNCSEDFNVASYAKKHFKMFNGTEVEVKLEIKKDIMNYILDELGNDVIVEENKDGRYFAIFTAAMGEGLVLWLLQIGNNAKVIQPQELQDRLLEKINLIVNIYK